MTPRRPMLEALVAMLTPSDVLVSSLGANSRYLPHLNVKAPVFALCDSMGAAIPLALGMALQRPDRHVVALEGDVLRPCARTSSPPSPPRARRI